MNGCWGWEDSFVHTNDDVKTTLCLLHEACANEWDMWALYGGCKSACHPCSFTEGTGMWPGHTQTIFTYIWSSNSLDHLEMVTGQICIHHQIAVIA